MSLSKRVGELVTGLGADFAGVADLSLAREAIGEQGGETFARYPFAVSIGIRLMDSIIDELPNRDQRWVAATFRLHAYDLVNARLDAIISRAASLLQNEGFRALPIPASNVIDGGKLIGAFSHKLAAHLAGLGWIGKSCLLVTPQAGPRVRWATVLTTAPLEPSGRPLESQCGTCTNCADICPAKAFTGRIFREDEPRAFRFDAHACKAHLQEREKATGLSVCGLCTYACPHGSKARTSA
jgi:epoxyqueuosine reductase QueG